MASSAAQQVNCNTDPGDPSTSLVKGDNDHVSPSTAAALEAPPCLPDLETTPCSLLDLYKSFDSIICPIYSNGTTLPGSVLDMSLISNSRDAFIG